MNPAASDERAERTRTATVMLMAGTVLLAVALIISVVARPTPLWGHAPYAITGALHVGALVLLRRGRLRLAVGGFAVLYLAMALGMAVDDGLFPAAFVLPPLVLFVGLTAGGRPALATAAAAVIGSLAVVVFVDHPDRPPVPPIRMWLVTAVSLGVTGSMMWVALRARRAVDAARRRSDALFRRVFESSGDAMGVVVEGRVVEVNPAVERLFGLSRAQLLDDPEAARSIWGDASVRDAVYTRLVRDGKIENLEHSLRRGDGTMVEGLLTATPFQLADRQATLFVFRDLTTQMSERRALARSERELRARNAEMEQFTYTVSHDLKSPLVTINGFLGAIQADLDAGRLDQVGTDLARISTAAGRMRRLLDDLLELSRVGRVGGTHTKVALADVVSEAIELAGGRLRACHATITVAPSLPSVWGDRERLVQVVQNLIDNAAKYVGDQPAPQVTITAERDGEHVVLSVRDNGLGMESRHFERVFSLFDKLDPRSDGTGVGLALVRRIVEFHGGKVWVESPGIGHGCTFRVSLPAPDP